MSYISLQGVCAKGCISVSVVCISNLIVVFIVACLAYLPKLHIIDICILVHQVLLVLILYLYASKALAINFNYLCFLALVASLRGTHHSTRLARSLVVH